VHALLECPLAMAIWEGSSMERCFCDIKEKLMMDCVELAIIGRVFGQFCGSFGMRETDSSFKDLMKSCFSE